MAPRKSSCLEKEKENKVLPTGSIGETECLKPCFGLFGVPSLSHTQLSALKPTHCVVLLLCSFCCGAMTMHLLLQCG